MKPALVILTAILVILPRFAAGDEALSARVESLFSKLTNEQKVELLGGVDDFFVRGYPEIGLPKMRMADGPAGARNAGPSTAYAAGIALAAGWNPELAREIGTGIGRDARARGAHFLLGPGVNIYRAPQCGRNFEYFGEDPLLASRMAVGYIQGIQSQGVVATVKHFMGNNSEFDRHHVNSIIDERTKREIYLPAFEAAVKEAKVGAIMTSYNLVDGVYASHSRHLIAGIARQEWGFHGLMMSDWHAVHDGLPAAQAGLDLEMPAADWMTPEVLLGAVRDGKISQAEIDDKVRRILGVAVGFGFLDRPQQDLTIPLDSAKSREAALRGARQGIVLLKNDGVLPLDGKTIRTIAVIGPAAYPAVVGGGGSGYVQPFRAISALDGVTDFLGTRANVLYDRGIRPLDEVYARTHFVDSADGGLPPVKIEHYPSRDFSGPVASTLRAPRINWFAETPYDSREVGHPFSSARFSTGFVAEKSGLHHCFVELSTRDAFKLFVDDRLVLERKMDETSGVMTCPISFEAGSRHAVRLKVGFGMRWGPNKVNCGIIAQEDLLTPAAKQMAAAADAVVVMAGYDVSTEAEGFDRTFALPVGQDELIRSLAAVNKRTIVAITAGGAVDATGWLDQVPGLLHLWYPGQEGGRALAEILFGEISPGGCLPISWERAWADNPVRDNYYPNRGGKDCEYGEGVFVGYRGYEKNNVKPLFPFGHGLSYATFDYKNLKIAPAEPKPEETVTVTFDITNTGKVAADHVAQLYLGDPEAGVPRPPKELKGFQRVSLEPGGSTQVSLRLDPRARSFYDTAGKDWKQEPGEFRIFVGRSSADLLLSGQFIVTE